jgi:hypothetical protein
MVPHRRALHTANSPLPIDEHWILNVLAAEEALKSERALCPSRPARLAARVFWGRLDRALIGGADPSSSPRLAARAALLTAPRTRAELADSLDLIVASAQQPPSLRRVRPRPSSVLASAPLMRELAATLRGPSPLYARGIAMLHRLLTDGTGPMYASRDGAALQRELREVRTAVCG